MNLVCLSSSSSSSSSSAVYLPYPHKNVMCTRCAVATTQGETRASLSSFLGFRRLLRVSVGRRILSLSLSLSLLLSFYHFFLSLLLEYRVYVHDKEGLRTQAPHKPSKFYHCIFPALFSTALLCCYVGSSTDFAHPLIKGRKQKRNNIAWGKYNSLLDR